MTKPLKRTAPSLWHWRDGEHRPGPNPDMRGNCTGLSGNCTGLSGNCTGLSGDLLLIPAEARPCDISDWIEEE